ncbi:cobalamin biosynthesis CobW [Tanacetum coccineum]
MARDPKPRTSSLAVVILLIYQPQCVTSAFLEASLSEPRTEPRTPAQYLVPTCYLVIGATWSVIRSGAVIEATNGPPVNGAKRRSTMAHHCQTPSDYQSTTSQRWMTVSQHVGQRLGQRVRLPRGMPRVSYVCPRGIHVDANVAEGIITLLHRFELGTSSSEVENKKWRRLLLHWKYVAFDVSTDGHEEDLFILNGMQFKISNNVKNPIQSPLLLESGHSSRQNLAGAYLFRSVGRCSRVVGLAGVLVAVSSAFEIELEFVVAQHDKWIAVIENEFGEVDIDGHGLLVASHSSANEDIVMVNNGCLCCTVRGEPVTMLLVLVKKRRDKFDHIVIETTGLAKRGPHLNEVKPRFVVNEAVEQVAYADCIIMNKIDLCCSFPPNTRNKILRVPEFGMFGWPVELRYTNAHIIRGVIGVISAQENVVALHRLLMEMVLQLAGNEQKPTLVWE